MAARADIHKVDLLILLRLSYPLKAPTASRLRGPLERYVVPPVAKARWPALFDERVAALQGEGALRDYTPTPLGRRRLTEAVGIDRIQWRHAKPYLAILALGYDPRDHGIVGRMRNAGDLTAGILDRTFDLGLPAVNLADTVDRLVHRELTGRDGPLTLDAVRAHVLSGLLDRATGGDPERLARILAAQRIGAAGTEADDLIAGLAHRWLTVTTPRAAPRPPPARPPDGADSLQGFADQVTAAAHAVPEGGRWGDRKVFISAIWRALDPRSTRMGLDRFKERLCEANRAGLLALHRADLVGAMDPGEVAASETRYLNATFHFVETTPTR